MRLLLEEDMSQTSGKNTNGRHQLDVGVDAPRGEKMCMKMNQIISTENENTAMKRESRNWRTAEDRMVSDKYVSKSVSASLQKIRGDNVIAQVHPKNPLTLFLGGQGGHLGTSMRTACSYMHRYRLRNEIIHL